MAEKAVKYNIAAIKNNPPHITEASPVPDLGGG
jgi:hypothetical protein